jgi:hypothetical protein
MLRLVLLISILAVSVNVDGCIRRALNSAFEEEPKLTDQEREIVERRNRYGERTTFDRPADDGAWIYDSETDDWQRVYD